MQLHEVVVVEFLTKLFDDGHGYSSLNSARSALSSFLCSNSGLTIGKFPSVIRFMKGIYELKPLALTTGQRAQTLHKVDICNINVAENLIIIPITELVKQSNPNRPNRFALHLKPYKECPDICVVKTLLVYLERTKTLRGTCTKLFISTIKPHNPISKDTVSRWLKTVLFEAGVETEIFTAHSTRAAKASKDFYNGIPIEEIIDQVGWSNSKTFQMFYNKVLITESCG